MCTPKKHQTQTQGNFHVLLLISIGDVERVPQYDNQVYDLLISPTSSLYLWVILTTIYQ